MKDLTAIFLKQLETVDLEFRKLQKQSQYKDLSDIAYSEQQRVAALARAAIERISGERSPYSRQVAEILKRSLHEGVRTAMIAGVAESLRADLSAGYLSSVSELLHGAVFGDFLEMADHLVSQGYKDAGAVVAGSALEANLRQLCEKNGIDVELSKDSGQRPKKADQLNSELASAEIYEKLDQKSVTAWLDIRNKAAHGDYDSYTEQQVSLMIQGIRDFITRHPA